MTDQIQTLPKLRAGQTLRRDEFAALMQKYGESLRNGVSQPDVSRIYGSRNTDDVISRHDEFTACALRLPGDTVGDMYANACKLYGRTRNSSSSSLINRNLIGAGLSGVVLAVATTAGASGIIDAPTLGIMIASGAATALCVRNLCRYVPQQATHEEAAQVKSDFEKWAPTLAKFETPARRQGWFSRTFLR